MSFITCENKELFALVDCNNFFVSCEKLFNPKLLGKAVVVLSSNAGCVVARSEEAKALGIPMGAAYFEWKDFFEAKGGVALLCNFELYGDISRRVMQTLLHFHKSIEIYSIDEAFLSLSSVMQVHRYALFLRKKVLQWTGIAVSIGVAKTKTLAKLASEKAKKSQEGVYLLNDEEKIDKTLSEHPVEDIWGIGRRMAQFFNRKGIRTALELKQKEELWVFENLSSPFQKTVLELKGISCLPLQELECAKKSIMTSRTFKNAISDADELKEAILHFTRRVSEKLREEKRCAARLLVFLMTSPYVDDFYVREEEVILDEPTHFTPKLLEAATLCFEKIYRPERAYKRAGVMVRDLVDENEIASSFFAPTSNVRLAKEKKLAKLVDEINQSFGESAINFGIDLNFEKEKGYSPCSPSYTTAWEDLLTIQI